MTAPPTTVFLDRDGTINEKAAEGSYVGRPDHLVLLTGAARAIARLNDAGVRTVLVTNQRGVARGHMSEADVRSTHERLAHLLAAEGAHLDAIYYCPHEIGRCECRKPAIGMVLQAVRDHPDIDLRRSALVGDADSDVTLGESLNLRTIRIGSRRPHDAPSTASAPDLDEAVRLLLGSSC